MSSLSDLSSSDFSDLFDGLDEIGQNNDERSSYFLNHSYFESINLYEDHIFRLEFKCSRLTLLNICTILDPEFNADFNLTIYEEDNITYSTYFRTLVYVSRMTTPSFLRTVGRNFGLSKSTVCEICKDFSMRLCRLAGQYVK